MSARTKLLFPAAAMPIAAITLIAGLWLIGEEERDYAFWITVIPILLAECMMGLSAGGIGGGRRGRFPLFRAESGAAAATYLGFTLIMLIPYFRGASPQTLLTVQLIGLALWLVLQLLRWLADRDGRFGSAFAATGCNKTGFSLETASLLADLKSRCPEQAGLIRESGRLAEIARFSAESVIGSEGVDEMICEGLQKLRAAGCEMPPEQMRQEMESLRELFRRREELIRDLRVKE